jgi:hypothetical protein
MCKGKERNDDERREGEFVAVNTIKSNKGSTGGGVAPFIPNLGCRWR